MVLGALSLHATAPLSQIGNQLGSSAIVLLAAGIIIFVIAFYGCCGAVRESHCMLVTVSVARESRVRGVCARASLPELVFWRCSSPSCCW